MGADNIKIAKNTIYLYIRTIIIMVLSLLSTRILLKQLGVDDYGMYNVVAGIVAMFSSLRGMLASATQRYLNYERKENSIDRLRSIFTVSLRLHWIVCFVFFVVAEIVGLWLLSDKLNISTNQILDAHIVLQCSIITAIVTILTVPYDAVIISNEHFAYYAYFAVLDCVLKLFAACALFVLPSDRVAWYAIIMLVVAVVIRVINMVYCKKHFEECSGRGNFERNLAKEMSKFAGWNFLGNTAFAIYNEGINLLLNFFGGVVANAARAVSYQVLHAAETMCSKLVAAASPQAVHQYALGNRIHFFDIINISAKLMCLMYLLIAVPVCYFTRDILTLWLGTVPDYAISFTRMILIYGFFRTIHSPLDLCFKASGKMAKYQIMELFCLTFSVALAYLFLKNNAPIESAFLSMIICNVLNLLLMMLLARRQVGFDLSKFGIKVILPLAIIIISLCSIIFILSFVLAEYRILFGIVIFVIVLFLEYIIGLTKKERSKFEKLIKLKLKR